MLRIALQSLLEAALTLLSLILPEQLTTASQKQQSFALSNNEAEKLHLDVKALQNASTHEVDADITGRSGFYLLSENLQAFLLRRQLIRRAKKTIDLQYYYFHGDTTGHLLAEQLIKAANQGVRVRVLLDDIDTLGADESIRILNAHPDIEIRLFNPFKFRGLLRYIELLTNLEVVGRRMHNKAMTVDNTLSIIGGRNIGDIYFSADPEQLVLDIDLLTIGPVVNDISSSFDEYWNSQWAVPVDDLYSKPDSHRALKKIRHYLHRYVQDVLKTDFITAIENQDNHYSLLELPIVWADAQLFSDSPSKVNSFTDIEQVDSELADAKSVDAKKQVWLDQLRHELDKAKQEVVLISPYFVPGGLGVSWLKQLVQKGVSVSVITNSLAATDVVAVHVGYSRYRKALLRAGIKLYELKPTLHAREKPHFKLLSAGSRTSLHAKTVIIDRQKVFIGSANLDPRSKNLNTEMGLLVNNKNLAQQVAGVFDEVTRLHMGCQDCYRVELQQLNSGEALQWVSLENGEQARYNFDPGVSPGRKLKFYLYRLLPIDNLL